MDVQERRDMFIIKSIGLFQQKHVIFGTEATTFPDRLTEIGEMKKVKKNNNTTILPSQLNPLQPGEQSHWYVPCASVHVPPFWHGFIGRHLDST